MPGWTGKISSSTDTRFEGGEFKVEEPVTFSGSYTINSYRVDVEGHEGLRVTYGKNTYGPGDHFDAVYGTSISAKMSSRTGYTYEIGADVGQIGEDGNYVIPASDVTITGRYTPIPQTVTIAGSGVTVTADGVSHTVNGSFDVDYDKTIEVTIEDRRGYASSLTSSAGAISDDGSYTVKGPVTFTGGYTPIEYTVSLQGEGLRILHDGTAHTSGSFKVPYGSRISVEVEGRTGHTHTLSPRTAADGSYTVRGDVTFSVGYTPIQCKVSVEGPDLAVSFNGSSYRDGGSFSVPYGTVVTVSGSSAALDQISAAPPTNTERIGGNQYRITGNAVFSVDPVVPKYSVEFDQREHTRVGGITVVSGGSTVRQDALSFEAEEGSRLRFSVSADAGFSDRLTVWIGIERLSLGSDGYYAVTVDSDLRIVTTVNSGRISISEGIDATVDGKPVDDGDELPDGTEVHVEIDKDHEKDKDGNPGTIVDSGGNEIGPEGDITIGEDDSDLHIEYGKHYTLAYTVDGTVVKTERHKAGEALDAYVHSVPGRFVSSWSPAVPAIMPASDLTVYATTSTSEFHTVTVGSGVSVAYNGVSRSDGTFQVPHGATVVVSVPAGMSLAVDPGGSVSSVDGSSYVINGDVRFSVGSPSIEYNVQLIAGSHTRIFDVSVLSGDRRTAVSGTSFKVSAGSEVRFRVSVDAGYGNQLRVLLGTVELGTAAGGYYSVVADSDITVNASVDEPRVSYQVDIGQGIVATIDGKAFTGGKVLSGTVVDVSVIPGFEKSGEKLGTIVDASGKAYGASRAITITSDISLFIDYRGGKTIHIGDGIDATVDGKPVDDGDELPDGTEVHVEIDKDHEKDKDGNPGTIVDSGGNEIGPEGDITIGEDDSDLHIEYGKHYTLTYTVDGTVVKTERHKAGEALNAYVHSVPGRFVSSWSPAVPEVMPSSDLTVYATTSTSEFHTVTVGSGVSVAYNGVSHFDGTFQVPHGSVVTVTAGGGMSISVDPEGSASSEDGTSYVINGDVEFSAVSVSVQYSVQLIAGSHTRISDVSVLSGDRRTAVSEMSFTVSSGSEVRFRVSADAGYGNQLRVLLGAVVLSPSSGGYYEVLVDSDIVVNASVDEPRVSYRVDIGQGIAATVEGRAFTGGKVLSGTVVDVSMIPGFEKSGEKLGTIVDASGKAYGASRAITVTSDISLSIDYRGGKTIHIGDGIDATVDGKPVDDGDELPDGTEVHVEIDKDHEKDKDGNPGTIVDSGGNEIGPEGDITIGEDDSNLHIEYSRQYTITYVVDGAVVRTDSYKAGQAVEAYVHTVPGMEVSDWSPAVPEVMPASDLTVRATTALQFHRIVVGMHVNAVFGGIQYTDRTFQVPHGSVIAVSAAAGMGLSVSPEGSAPSDGDSRYVINGDVEFAAVPSSASYTVQFIAGDHTGVSDITVTYRGTTASQSGTSFQAAYGSEVRFRVSADQGYAGTLRVLLGSQELIPAGGGYCTFTVDSDLVVRTSVSDTGGFCTVSIGEGLTASVDGRMFSGGRVLPGTVVDVSVIPGFEKNGEKLGTIIDGSGKAYGAHRAITVTADISLSLEYRDGKTIDAGEGIDATVDGKPVDDGEKLPDGTEVHVEIDDDHEKDKDGNPGTIVDGNGKDIGTGGDVVVGEDDTDLHIDYSRGASVSIGEGLVATVGGEAFTGGKVLKGTVVQVSIAPGYEKSGGKLGTIVDASGKTYGAQKAFTVSGDLSLSIDYRGGKVVRIDDGIDASVDGKPIKDGDELPDGTDVDVKIGDDNRKDKDGNPGTIVDGNGKELGPDGTITIGDDDSDLHIDYTRGATVTIGEGISATIDGEAFTGGKVLKGTSIHLEVGPFGGSSSRIVASDGTSIGRGGDFVVEGDVSFSIERENGFFLVFFDDSNVVVARNGVILSSGTALPSGTVLHVEPVPLYAFIATVGASAGTVSYDGSYLLRSDVTFTCTYERILFDQYEVTWLNWDGTVLLKNLCFVGDYPVYAGVTPTKPADGERTYTFGGWSPSFARTVSDTTYTAVFITHGPNEPKIGEGIDATVDGKPLDRGELPEGTVIDLSIKPGYQKDKDGRTGVIVDSGGRTIGKEGQVVVGKDDIDLRIEYRDTHGVTVPEGIIATVDGEAYGGGDLVEGTVIHLEIDRAAGYSGRIVASDGTVIGESGDYTVAGPVSFSIEDDSGSDDDDSTWLWLLIALILIAAIAAGAYCYYRTRSERD